MKYPDMTWTGSGYQGTNMDVLLTIDRANEYYRVVVQAAVERLTTGHDHVDERYQEWLDLVCMAKAAIRAQRGGEFTNGD